MYSNSSNRLSDDERQQMRAQINRYFMAMIESVPEDSAFDDMIYDLWYASLSHNQKVFTDVATELYSDYDSGRTPMIRYASSVGAVVEFHDGLMLALATPSSNLHSRPGNHRAVPSFETKQPCAVKASTVLRTDQYERLYEHAKNTAEIGARLFRADCLFDEIIGMANTVGQLARMSRDLVKYTYNSTQKALEQQQRRSPLPYGWDRVDRGAVHDAVDQLALCYLLPKANHGSQNWMTATSERAWAYEWTYKGRIPYETLTACGHLALSRYAGPRYGWATE